MPEIIFVCTGNVCRSPMAAGLLKERLAEKGRDDEYEVRSAGVYGLDGRRASRNAIFVMAERGVDIADHIAHTLTGEDVAQADLVLAMSREHAQFIRQSWPQYAWKIYLLSEMAGQRESIADPFGGPLEDYRTTADLIERYIDKGLERILELT
jgi:protein-tyrosine-phosphatase